MTDRAQRNRAARATMIRVSDRARRRMLAADPLLRGLRPSETDWMTGDELAAHHAAELEFIKTEPTQAELRERVRAKRAARVAAMKNQ